MNKTIAVAGKGGVGKTTISALLIRHIVEKIKRPVLAIDADPNENLSSMVGIRGKIATMMDVAEEVLKKPERIPPSMGKEQFINLHIQEAVIEEQGFDFLAMGRPEGPGCYCYANNLLRGLTEKIKSSYDFTVIDNEAGLEHLSRRITTHLDILIMICGMDVTSFRTVERILQITEDLKFDIKEKFLIANRAVYDLPANPEWTLFSGKKVNFVGKVDDDQILHKLSLEGKSIFKLSADAVSFRQAEEIFGKIF